MIRAGRFSKLEFLLVAALLVSGFSYWHSDVSPEVHKKVIVIFSAKLGSASLLNYVARKADPRAGISVSDCADIAATLEEGLPSGYEIRPGTKIAPGSTTNCLLQRSDDYQISNMFLGYGIE
jgi:hypothetical protein